MYDTDNGNFNNYNEKLITHNMAKSRHVCLKVP